jgi:threonine/homoserine/homoserine lactone efflux protein
VAGIEHLGLFLAAGLLLNLTPGPDVLYIVSQGLKGGWRAGVVAALGITGGIFVHIAVAALGLGALLAASQTAFTLLKWAGAAYLLYIGWGMLGLRRPAAGSASVFAANKIAIKSMESRPRGQFDYKKIFRQGFWTNALNPKVALFFLAFLPQFIAPEAEHKALTFVLLGLLFNLNSLPINLGYALLAAWAGQRLQSLQQGLAWLERLAGALFIGFGLKLALTDPPTP